MSFPILSLLSIIEKSLNTMANNRNAMPLRRLPSHVLFPRMQPAVNNLRGFILFSVLILAVLDQMWSWMRDYKESEIDQSHGGIRLNIHRPTEQRVILYQNIL